MNRIILPQRGRASLRFSPFQIQGDHSSIYAFLLSLLSDQFHISLPRHCTFRYNGYRCCIARISNTCAHQARMRRSCRIKSCASQTASGNAQACKNARYLRSQFAHSAPRRFARTYIRCDYQAYRERDHQNLRHARRGNRDHTRNCRWTKVQDRNCLRIGPLSPWRTR